jgi:TetR/AcrR family transcriptional regulator, mexJK operon transcriptional repressor
MAEESESKDRWTAMKGGRDERRDAIVAVANQAFLESGFAGTSMSAIAQRCKGSKGTLYNYFSSKDELFAAVIERRRDQFASVLSEAVLEGGTLHDALMRVGLRILESLLSDEFIATHRMITAECVRFPEIGRALYGAGSIKSHGKLAQFFEQANEAGQLRPGTDPALASEQFFALCLADIQQRRLWNVAAIPDEAELRARVEAAVDTFLRAFAA